MKVKYFNIIFCILVFASVLLLSEQNVMVMKRLAGKVVSSDHKRKPVIVLDAGHGGFDPGKIGINQAKEKDINLSIALELKELLEQNDFHVVMTRNDDSGLYDDKDSNKKQSDMKKRMEIINGSNADLAISIHQNSFTEESSHGAQVFYYSKSMEAKKLAGVLQEQLKKSIQDGNHRVEKANDSYYLLKKSECPLVIVECGFLSNQKEAALLITKEYQRNMAWFLHLGIISYFNDAASDLYLG